MKNFALIMAGGKGTRVWPESTDEKPKQYLPIVGESSLLHQTLERFEGYIPADQRYIITTEEQRPLATEHSNGLMPSENLILEPEGRNTAPCILLALLDLLARGASEEDIVSIVSSDHLIRPHQAFQDDLKKAAELASEGFIVTLGIPVRNPHTGYGYILRGEQQGPGFKVQKFVEKPDLETAKKYQESGEYYWNAGNFVAKISTMLKEFSAHCPEIAQFKDELLSALQSKSGVANCYSKLAKISIDYAVMEKSENVAVVPVTFEWNDLGSWDALEEVISAKEGNCFIKDPQKSFVEDSQGNIILSQSTKNISLLGVSDLVIIENGDHLVVFPKSRAQEIKKIRENFLP
jgi:mannose-1-phosphate guanylyltransferase